MIKLIVSPLLLWLLGSSGSYSDLTTPITLPLILDNTTFHFFLIFFLISEISYFICLAYRCLY